MNQGRVGTKVDLAIREYLRKKVREKFSNDFHLLEPIIDQLISMHTLNELYIVCSAELTRLKGVSKRQRKNELL